MNPPRILDVPNYIDSYTAVLRQLEPAVIGQVADAIFDAWRGRHTVFVCGNGGSASNASHIVTDLVKLTTPPQGHRLRAFALGESVSTMTALANDIAYDQVFAEQLRTFLEPDDVVIGLSTSGSSPNVLRAIEYANVAGAVTIGVTGRGGRQLQSLAQIPVVVASTSVQEIEDATMTIGHMACLTVRDRVLAASQMWSVSEPKLSSLPSGQQVAAAVGVNVQVMTGGGLVPGLSKEWD